MQPYTLVRILNDQGAAYEWDVAHPGGSASYTDFWAIARASGVPICELWEVDLTSDKAYIFAPANGYTEASFANKPRACRLIHWNIERPPAGTLCTPAVDYADEIWYSDLTQWGAAGDTRARYVPLGGHPTFGGESLLPKLWDFLPLCYAYGERLAKILDIASRGWTIAPNTFDPVMRNNLLSHSRWGLMLHQTPHPIMTPLRAVLYASWSLPIVAEHVGDAYPYRFIPYEPDLNTLRGVTEKEMEEIVEHNYAMVTDEHPFRKCIERALGD